MNMCHIKRIYTIMHAIILFTLTIVYAKFDLLTVTFMQSRIEYCYMMLHKISYLMLYNSLALDLETIRVAVCHFLPTDIFRRVIVPLLWLRDDGKYRDAFG